MKTEEFMKYRAEFMDKIQSLLKESKKELDKKSYLALLEATEAHIRYSIHAHKIKNGW